jgi:hypothetical protein
MIIILISTRVFSNPNEKCFIGTEFTALTDKGGKKEILQKCKLQGWAAFVKSWPGIAYNNIQLAREGYGFPKNAHKILRETKKSYATISFCDYKHYGPNLDYKAKVIFDDKFNFKELIYLTTNSIENAKFVGHTNQFFENSFSPPSIDNEHFRAEKQVRTYFIGFKQREFFIFFTDDDNKLISSISKNQFKLRSILPPSKKKYHFFKYMGVEYASSPNTPHLYFGKSGVLYQSTLRVPCQGTAPSTPLKMNPELQKILKGLR